MIDNSIEAVLIKVAAIGLNQTHLGKSLSQLYPYLCKLVNSIFTSKFIIFH